MKFTLRQLGIGTFGNIVKVSDEQKLIEVLDLLSKHHISAVPIIDANGMAIDAYSRSDVRFLALDKTYNKLDMTLREALAAHRNDRPVPTCSRDDSVATVCERLIATGKHRLIIVTPQKILEGLVSLSDLLHFFMEESHPSFNRNLSLSPSPDNIPAYGLSSTSPLLLASVASLGSLPVSALGTISPTLPATPPTTVLPMAAAPQITLPIAVSTVLATTTATVNNVTNPTTIPTVPPPLSISSSISPRSSKLSIVSKLELDDDSQTTSPLSPLSSINT